MSDETVRRTAPDILLIGTEWPARALLRAELIHAGHEVVAVDAWPVPREYFQPRSKPRVVVVDLHDLPEPDTVVAELPALTSPDRIVFIASLASVPADDLRRRGFHVVTRPASIGQIVAAVTHVLSGRG